MGYHRAGFDVVGVDIKPQKHYVGDSFIQADALTFDLAGYDAIHASPPCQAYSVLNAVCRTKHTLDLVPPIRERLIAAGVPWVIENVPGAPLRHWITLCGGMFGLRTYRHRRFESNILLRAPSHPRHLIRTNGTGRNRAEQWAAGLHACIAGHNHLASFGPAAMGIDWMTRAELAQAIPPAYTEWIGRQLITAVRQDREEQ